MLNFVHAEPVFKIFGSCSTAVCSRKLFVHNFKKKECWRGAVISSCHALKHWARKLAYTQGRKRRHKVASSQIGYIKRRYWDCSCSHVKLSDLEEKTPNKSFKALEDLKFSGRLYACAFYAVKGWCARDGWLACSWEPTRLISPSSVLCHQPRWDHLQHQALPRMPQGSLMKTEKAGN